MYEITSNNTTAVSDSIVEVVLSKNGSYTMPKNGNPAQGFVAKIPVTIEQEDPETHETRMVDTLADTVYVYDGQTMKGNEPIGKWAEVPAVPTITELESDLEQAYELLYG